MTIIINKAEVIEVLSRRNFRDRVVVYKSKRSDRCQVAVTWLRREKYMVLFDQLNIPGDVLDVFLLTKKGVSLCEELFINRGKS